MIVEEDPSTPPTPPTPQPQITTSSPSTRGPWKSDLLPQKSMLKHKNERDLRIIPFHPKNEVYAGLVASNTLLNAQKISLTHNGMCCLH
jgi:hypothetical protein